MLTGIGVLVSAYGSLHTGISAYHWQIAVFLAWFANLTHQSGLILREHLDRPGRTLERRSHAIMMTVLLLLLAAAIVPTAYFNWLSDDNPSAPETKSYAWCCFHVPIANELYRLAAERKNDTSMGT